MIRAFITALIEGMLAPRVSAARILGAHHRPETAVLMAILAYLLQAIIQILLPGARSLPDGTEAVPITLHVLNVTLQLVLVGALALGVFGLGRLFGGTGTRRQALVIVAWHALVTTLLAPVMLWGLADLGGDQPIPPVRFFLLMAGGAIWLWLLAVYTAVLHGFRSAWAVLGVILVVSFAIATFFLNLMPAP